jgi:hypothetical protein
MLRVLMILAALAANGQCDRPPSGGASGGQKLAQQCVQGVCCGQAGCWIKCPCW